MLTAALYVRVVKLANQGYMPLNCRNGTEIIRV